MSNPYTARMRKPPGKAVRTFGKMSSSDWNEWSGTENVGNIVRPVTTYSSAGSSSFGLGERRVDKGFQSLQRSRSTEENVPIQMESQKSTLKASPIPKSTVVAPERKPLGTLYVAPKGRPSAIASKQPINKTPRLSTLIEESESESEMETKEMPSKRRSPTSTTEPPKSLPSRSSLSNDVMNISIMSASPESSLSDEWDSNGGNNTGKGLEETMYADDAMEDEAAEEDMSFSPRSLIKRKMGGSIDRSDVDKSMEKKRGASTAFADKGPKKETKKRRKTMRSKEEEEEDEEVIELEQEIVKDIKVQGGMAFVPIAALIAPVKKEKEKLKTKVLEKEEESIEEEETMDRDVVSMEDGEDYPLMPSLMTVRQAISRLNQAGAFKEEKGGASWSKSKKY